MTSSAATASEPGAATRVPPPVGGSPRWRHPVVPWLALVTLAAALRATLIALDHGVTLDSDEAVIGLMARHILAHGARPIFFYGQEYMGAFEAYVAAAAFALAGASTLALKGTMLVLDLLLVLSFVALGRAALDRRAGWLAGLYAALAPAFLAIYGLKARGGYVETVLVGNLLFAGAASLGKLAPRACAVRALTLGALAGLGFWTHTLVALYFPVAALIWLASGAQARRLQPIALALAGALVGSAPFWWRNAHTGFQSFGNVSWVDGATAWRHLLELLRVGLPTVLGARPIWAFEEIAPAAGIAFALVNAWLALASVRRSLRPDVEPARRAVVLGAWATALLALAVDAKSVFGAESREPRYLFPVYTALGLSFGIAAADAWQRRQRAVQLLCVALLGGHLFGIARQDPALMLGISAGQRVAQRNDRLLALLDKLGIRSIYTDYWVSYRLAFESGERIRARPYGHVVVERIPAMSAEVEGDPNPAFVLLGDAASGFRAALERRGLGFRERAAGPYRVFYRVEGLDEVRRWTYPFG
ncbi:MAG: hypothetical protein U0610_22875 [bacterium]